jgi:hypothetical protein
MKAIVTLLVLLSANAVWAQVGPGGQELKKTTAATPAIVNQAAALKPALKPNEIAGTRPDVTYSGVLVQVKKTDNPLQLINPFAPARYGSGDQNFSRDVTGRGAGGLKFFSMGY